MASDALDLVFCLPFFDSLPLHVARIIGAAAGKRLDVIDDISRATARVTRLRHEEPLRGLAPYDVALCVPVYRLGSRISWMRRQPCCPPFTHLPFGGHGLGICTPLVPVVGGDGLVLIG